MRYTLIYLKLMANVSSKIIIFRRRVSNIVYMKNIKFGKVKFLKKLLFTGSIPFDRSKGTIRPVECTLGKIVTKALKFSLSP